MEKKCSKCRKSKSLSDFHKNKSTKDGHNTYCKVCATEVSKNWYRKNIGRADVYNRLTNYWRQRNKQSKDFVDSLKKACGCILCGEEEICCLDFHHCFGKKVKEISWLTKTKNMLALIEELKKCVCVCANCHRKIHAMILKLDANVLAQGSQIMYSSLYYLIKKDGKVLKVKEYGNNRNS